ncbi:uncharacterized protein AB675_2845 [Cyphellophora attinorum]|uniref:RBR-type E3 ubiquitin transferase n=1 Tax=Cyphellophora attinorum TaxID=1664694 RepID=A0A0N1HH37_9EURO|nr:uncharacterized protein AB675_2845 [Phialophora attinorum]KPI45146.1 hypothetical protein AB675_2845 [Phialophora attinorum]
MPNLASSDETWRTSDESPSPPAKRQRLSSTADTSLADSMSGEDTMESADLLNNGNALAIRSAPDQLNEAAQNANAIAQSAQESSDPASSAQDTTESSTTNDHDESVVAPTEWLEGIDPAAAPNDPSTENGAAATDDTESADEEATVQDDVVAVQEEVNNAAAAADRASADNAIDEQTQFLHRLSREDPDEFRRLVDSGIIDDEFLDRLDELNAQDAVAAPNADAQNNNAGNAGTNTESLDNDLEEGEIEDADAGRVNNANNQAGPTVAGTAGNHGIIAGPAPAQPGAGNGTGDRGHFAWLLDRRDAREANEACPACTVEFDPDEPTVFLNCGDRWCVDCLNDNYRAALKNRKDFPPQCCDIPLDHESIQDFLDEGVLIELATKIDEYKDADPVYCQTPKCTGGYIPKSRIKGQWAGCQVCSQSTCVECKGPASEHLAPQIHPKPLTKLDQELAAKEGWKVCPGCGNMVERSEGCNFMTCECGHNFCYQCGGSLQNNMPCLCQGTPQWVQQMNAEAAGGAESDDEDEEDDDEEGEGRDEGAGGHGQGVDANTGEDGGGETEVPDANPGEGGQHDATDGDDDGHDDW